MLPTCVFVLFMHSCEAGADAIHVPVCVCILHCRRVNALEHVVKPRLENTIAYIKASEGPGFEGAVASMWLCDIASMHCFHAAHHCCCWSTCPFKASGSTRSCWLRSMRLLVPFCLRFCLPAGRAGRAGARWLLTAEEGCVTC